MKITYLINQYPKVSHSFIRREILALEKQDFEVQRIAVRGWDGELVDEEDIQERIRTRYILQVGFMKLLLATLATFFAAPRLFFQVLRLAIKMGLRAERPLPIHLIYLAEACCMVPWMRQAGSQHIHAHFGTNSAEVAMFASMLSGIPYSITIHGSEEFDKPEFLWLNEKISRSAFVAGISSFGRSQIYRWASYADWPKVAVVHCGIEPAFHAGPPVLVTSLNRIVCVGRLCEQKGQLLLINAVNQLVIKGIDVELVLAGDGEMRAPIEALIAEYGLQARVRITGWISGEVVREELLASRGMVLPSFAEGLPVVVMEAMALRRPVLSTYIAGIPELVVPGETGWLFTAGDVDALVKALEDFLATPIVTLQQMGETAHYRVIERHSIDTEAAKLAKLFRAAPLSLRGKV
ncbi:glycosyltransferase [Actimicrobium sp. CCC2.4]|uniref:glycosyltransferase n=1 Tax=Actimicrobium sp. CCC2.4 TaxID=3048606 RepID=UPI002AC95196|nr:glycosyltransferase [Actimicrobium sp. CCC2.4]MEB0136033.1 glycosyltransferase [Actimicrobium sp. CCC2.4]WPX32696.1 glycosyltransferase [Actimicrobium sp. CCC2.4]